MTTPQKRAMFQLFHYGWTSESVATRRVLVRMGYVHNASVPQLTPMGLAYCQGRWGVGEVACG